MNNSAGVILLLLLAFILIWVVTNKNFSAAFGGADDGTN